MMVVGTGASGEIHMLVVEWALGKENQPNIYPLGFEI